jgi:glutamate/tyrosine decarboxylase-like PLP-dependent enzyme
MNESLHWLADEIARFYDDVPRLPATPTDSPETIRRHFVERYDFAAPLPLQEVLDDVSRCMRRWLTHVTHPRYFGYFNPSVTPESIIGDALTAAYNPQQAVWSHAPAAVEIERRVLEVLAAQLGYPPDSLAHFTSGGAEANHTAALVALTHRYPTFAAEGAASIGARPRICVSDAAHDSFIKIAHATGIGRRAVRVVAVDDRFRMRPDALADAVAEDRRNGFDPAMIVGTAGTTAAGAVDPLPALADFCEREKIWLHVDTAWAGACVLSDKLRSIVAGIERADSITWDAHKSLAVPMGAGMFFCRHPRAVLDTFAVRTAYMPAGTAGTLDPYASTMQWSRRCIGLKVFVSLAAHGLSGYARMFEHQTHIGDVLRDRLRAAGWTITNDTPLPVACFTHASLADRPADLDRVRDRVLASGVAWISMVRLSNGRPALRACITSYRTDERDIDMLVNALEGALRSE